MEIIRPWASGRVSIYAWLADSERTGLPDDDLWSRVEGEGDQEAPIRRPLPQMAADGRVFGRFVTPCVDELPEETTLAGLVSRLLRDARGGSLDAAVQLYQLFVCQDRMRWAVWPLLHEHFSDQAQAEDLFVFTLFDVWLRESPDREIVDLALFVLTRHRRPPCEEVLRTLGRDWRFASGAASVLATHYAPAEDALIEIGRQHGGNTRHAVLSYLTRVEHPANRRWLLTEAYDLEDYYSPAGFPAAIHGRLLDALREHPIEPEMLVHHARMLGGLSSVARGGPRGDSIANYADGPEAVALLLDAVEDEGTPEPFWRPLVDVLYFMETVDEDEAALWTPEVTAPLASRLRALLSAPHVRPDLFWWERRTPTLEDLEAGNLSVLNTVADAAADDEDALRALVDWAEDFLSLDEPDDVRTARRAELLVIALDGVRVGGLAGMTDDDLGSVYGQVLLQVLLKLRGRAPMAHRLVRQAVSETMPHVPETAAAILAKWQDDTSGADRSEV